MRPKIAMWYTPPTQKRWWRTTRSSTGLKILLVGGICIAGVIGLSDIYSRIIDSEWTQETSTDSQRVAHPEAAPSPRRSGIAAEIPLPPRRTPVTTGVGVTPTPAPTPTPAVTPAPATPPGSGLRALAGGPAPAQPARAAAAMPAPAPASSLGLSEMRPSVAATEQPAAADAPLAVADVPEVQAIADSSAKPAPAVTYGVRPAQRYVAKAPVVKRRVVRTEHHRGYSGAYAQNGGGWGGSSGWPGLGSPYHF
jgi:hypothetical protein